MHGSSLVHFARGLAARKYFTYGDLGRFAYAQAKFQLLGRENSDDVAAGKTKALAFIEGRSTAELEAVGEEIYDEIIADKIWPGTRALAQMHLDAGQQVWLVTATPYELAATIAKRLGLTGALGTVAESVDGIFTGRLVGDILHGTGKARRALAGHPRGAEPAPLHGLLRQLQRRADAVAGRHRPSRSTPTPTCATWPASAAGRSAISAPRARPPASGCRRRWRWARPAARWQPSFAPSGRQLTGRGGGAGN